MKLTAVKHEFVEFIPETLTPGVLYISIPYATAAHQCCCGCGKEVVTPISPTDWELAFNGVSVSLAPSIGNWGFPCQSHYWIKSNRVRWAKAMSAERIELGRSRDRLAKERQFHNPATTGENAEPQAAEAPKPRRLAWKKFKKWWGRDQ